MHTTIFRPQFSAGFLVAAMFLFAISFGAAEPAIQQIDVFTSGTNGYAGYRIPALVATSHGALLALAEGRKYGAGDAGRIDLVLRCSVDSGLTWGPMQVVWSDGANTCGNPAPVVDASTGRIWLLSTWNLATDAERRIEDGTSTDTRRVFAMHSDDDGDSWTSPTEITPAAKQPDWRWYATGPGHAIQLRDGRLVVPANHSSHDGTHGLTSSHVIVSDDHGATWHISKPVGGHTNESTVAELDDGSLYLNMRSSRELKQRAISRSQDRGETWSEPANDPALIEPVCEGSVLRYAMGAGKPSLFLFSNPASSTKRERMTIRTSRDGCRTWTTGTLIHKGMSAYSDLCALPHDNVGLLYERDATKAAPGRITFARIPLTALLKETTSTDEIRETKTTVIRGASGGH